MRLRPTLLAAGLVLSAGMPAYAATYYVAPKGADLCADPDGSETCPFATPLDAIKAAVGGDTILLMDGEHGRIETKDLSFATTLTIKSEHQLQAHIDGAKFGGTSKNIKLENLTVWSVEGSGPRDLISSSPESSSITVQGLDIRTRENAIDYQNWSEARWIEVSATGVKLLGVQNEVRNNTIRGVGFGIVVGRGSLVEANTIDGFSKDGLRGSNKTTFRNNTVKNCVNVDNTHNDGIQSYAGASNVTGLRIEGNTIIEWDRNTQSPIRCAMQGIGLFDGYYDNLIVTNNLVAVRGVNGIAVLGARQAKITNNTVVNISGAPGKAPIIRLGDRKESRGGGASQNVVVANNIAMSFMGKSNTTNNVIFAGNAVIPDPAKALENVSAFNYIPKLTSGFVDSGDTRYAPKLDILNHARPYGKGPDKGAYEVGGR